MIPQRRPADAWAAEKAWSDKFVKQLKAICGQHILQAASIDDDRQKGTDLSLSDLSDGGISCRVRRHKQMRYKDDFCLRGHCPDGLENEVEKILSGHNRLYIYAFSNEAEDDLSFWSLYDLNVFRRWWCSESLKNAAKQSPGQLKRLPNGDAFWTFKIADLPPEFIIASGGSDG